MHSCHADQERFRFAKQTSFGRRHLSSWSNTNVTLWIVCFFRQLFGSVTEVDYKTLRHGFITVVNLITHFVLFYLLFSIKWNMKSERAKWMSSLYWLNAYTFNNTTVTDQHNKVSYNTSNCYICRKWSNIMNNVVGRDYK